MKFLYPKSHAAQWAARVFFFLPQIRDSFSKDFDFDLYDLSVAQEHFKLKRCLYEALDLALNVC